MKYLFVILSLVFVVTSCSTDVNLKAPDKPIAITIDIKHRIEIEKQVEKTINSNDKIF